MERFLSLQRLLGFRHPHIRQYSDVPGRRHLVRVEPGSARRSSFHFFCSASEIRVASA